MSENMQCEIMPTEITYDQFKVFLLKTNYTLSHEDVVRELNLDPKKVDYRFIHIHSFCLNYKQNLSTILIPHSYLTSL